MDRDTLVEKAVKHYFEASRDAHDDKVLLHVPTMMADFALEQYEAGQREERERIVRQFEAISQSDDGTCYADYSDAIDAFIDKLRADPAESGE